MWRNVKRGTAVAILTGCLLFGGINASAATFQDVQHQYWAKEEITFLVEQSIIKGYKDGTFQPEQTITKAQAATMLVRALQLQTTNNPDPHFLDVSKQHTAYQEIAAAVAAGIFPAGGNFNPNEQLTREAVAEAMANAFQLESIGQFEFKDVPKTAKGYQAIASLAEHDIAKGYSDGTFKPNEKVTRAQFSAFIARALSTDFLPTQYNIPFNVNPAVLLFSNALTNPSEAQNLFVDHKFDVALLAKQLKNLELVEVKEVARLNGEVEFAVTVKAELVHLETSGFLNEGENQLYMLITRNGYMDYKIVSISKNPHLHGDDGIQFTTDNAQSLFEEAQQGYWYVVMGGEGKRNEATFTYKGVDYRYMAETLNTMEKLQAYLGTVYTGEQIEGLIKTLGIIEHSGFLAQPNADGGSLLNWRKATTKETVRTASMRSYEMIVPIGEEGEYETLLGELHFVKGKGWRVHRLETKANHEPVTLTSEEALALFHRSQTSYWYVVSGGEGKRDSTIFTYNDQYYRYMAETLNTAEKLKAYLGAVYTEEQANHLIETLGIIEYKGVLIQPDADGGSLLDWGRTTIKELSSTGNVKSFEMTVPIGDSNEFAKYVGELHYIEGLGWRVHKLEGK
ncbi:DL-endopeptidase inhibitor IseA family protein [Lysinibacillus sp. KU-BSD001]|uniref:DL-endopeptidase inhibitor IseA family protein n=1 Tax=Lysinibacillus sp. KU-BSD001 TaxID=3141328 RepID=UPI0036EF2313